MKRRSFLGATAGTLPLVSGITGCDGKKHKKIEQKVSGDRLCTLDGKLAGMTLEELREQYRYDLFDDFLVFYDKHIIDREHGGFMVNADHDGTHINTNKRNWYEGRGIWTYCFLYNNIAKEDKYLDVATRSVKFLLKHQPKGDNLWPSEYTREGEVIRKTVNTIPGECYIAEGFAEYAKATGEQKYMDLATETLFKCLRLYDRPDYKDGSCPFPGARNMWYDMLFFWFASRMLSYKPDAEMENLVNRFLDAFINYYPNPDFDLMNMVLNHDNSRAEAKYAQEGACDHATEALCMVH